MGNLDGDEIYKDCKQKSHPLDATAGTAEGGRCRMIHELKIRPEFFEACTSGKKTFEVRRNDRPFEIGDYLALNEWNGEIYTGRCALFNITYILSDTEYCKPGYAIISIVPCAIRRDVRMIPVYSREDTP